MNLFTIIWGGMLIFAFFNKDIKKMLFLTLLSMLFQCANFISYNGLGVGPQIITSLLFIVKYMSLSKKKLVLIKNNRIKIIDFILLFIILLASYSSYSNGVLNDKILNIIQLIVYVFCYFSMRKVSYYLEDNELYSMIRKLIVFVVTIGLIQWISTNFISPLRTILKPLLYNDNSMNVYFNYNDPYHNKRIYAMFMEPSYLAGFLVGAFYYILSYTDKFKSNIFLLFITLIEIILTTSSTAYVAFASFGLIFILYSKQLKFKSKLLIIILGLVSCFIMYFFFYDLLDAVIFSKSQSGSGVTRIRWNREALEAFNTSKLIGVGYKNIRGSSIIYSLLGELGVLGLVSYIMFVFMSVYKFFIKNKNNMVSVGYYGTMAAVIAMSICQIVACPDLDLCTFWLWLYILSAYEGKFIKNIVQKEG